MSGHDQQFGEVVRFLQLRGGDVNGDFVGVPSSQRRPCRSRRWTTLGGMRLGLVTFGVALAGLLVSTSSEASAAAAGLAVAALLTVLGFREGSWRALRWACVVPAAAVVAGVITFTPMSLQTEPEANLSGFVVLSYLPLYALLVGLGVATRRLRLGPRRIRP